MSIYLFTITWRAATEHTIQLNLEEQL